MIKSASLILFTAISLSACSTSQTITPDRAGSALSKNWVAESFAVNAYHELGAGDGNVFASPVSISSAFELLYPGARGQTAEEIQSVFRYGNGYDAAYRELTSALSNGEKILTIANAVWIEQSFNVEPAYLESVNQGQGVGVEQVDMIGMPEKVRETINQWTEENTNGRIKDLLSPGFIDPQSTRLVLTNAVHFKADWAQPFDPNYTRTGEFFTASGEVVTAQVMKSEIAARYITTDMFQAAEFSYADDEYTLSVFLPQKEKGLAAFEERLTPMGLRNWLNELSRAAPVNLNVELPKVGVQMTYDLAAPLQNLGVVSAFSKSADLSGISKEASLKLDRVVHKTFLAIDEKGTEAAAATGMGIVVTGARREPLPEFIVDHPFFFVLRHKHSGFILFIGRVTDV